MVNISIVTMLYKPTYNWGGHHAPPPVLPGRALLAGKRWATAVLGSIGLQGISRRRPTGCGKTWFRSDVPFPDANHV